MVTLHSNNPCDDIIEFVNDMLIFSKGKDDMVNIRELYIIYKQWARESIVTAVSVPKFIFYLKDLSFYIDRRFIYGVIVNEDNVHEDYCYS